MPVVGMSEFMGDGTVAGDAEGSLTVQLEQDDIFDLELCCIFD